MISRTQFISLFSLVVLNNLAWFVYVQGKQASIDPVDEITQETIAKPQITKQTKTSSATEQRSVSIVPGGEHFVAEQVQTQSEGEQAQIDEDAPDLADEQIMPLAAEAQNMFYEKKQDVDYFFYNDNDKKIETLAVLSAQGEDLNLLREVIAREENKQVKVAAIRKLNEPNNYMATSMLLQALDDPAPEVSLAAMETLVKNGDRTLLPGLKAKFANSDMNDPIIQEMNKLIQELEYSVSMQMDDLH